MGRHHVRTHTLHVEGLGEVSVTWDHRRRREQIQGKYHPLLITDTTSCALTKLGPNPRTLTAVERCSIKDQYDPTRRIGLLEKVIAQAGWDRPTRAAFYKALWAVTKPPRPIKRRQPIPISAEYVAALEKQITALMGLLTLSEASFTLQRFLKEQQDGSTQRRDQPLRKLPARTR